MPERAAPLRRGAVRGVASVLAQNIGSRAVTIGGQFVLAALLQPDDFGVFGLALTIFVLSSAVVDIGLDQVLLQRNRALRLWLVPARSFTMLLAVLGGFIGLAAASLADLLYNAPGVSRVAVVLALAIPPNILATLPTIVLQADLRFGLLSRLGLAMSAASMALSIGLSLIGWGVMSLAVPIPTLAIVNCALLLRSASPTAPKEQKFFGSFFQKRTLFLFIRPLWPRIAQIFTTRLVISAMNQGDYVILGLLYPADLVGYYVFAFRLAAQPLRILASGLMTVLLPVLSRVRGDRLAMGDAALRVARLLCLLVMPAVLLQGAMAGPLLHLLFGAKWDPATPLIRVLSLGLGFDAVSWVAGTLLAADGKFRRSLIYTLQMAPWFWILVWIGAWYDAVTGTAIAAATFYLVFPPLFSIRAFARYDIGAWTVAKAHLLPAGLAVAAILGVEQAIRLGGIDDPLTRMTVLPIGLILYAAALRLLMPRDAAAMLAALRQVAGRG